MERPLSDSPRGGEDEGSGYALKILQNLIHNLCAGGAKIFHFCRRQSETFLRLRLFVAIAICAQRIHYLLFRFTLELT